jgi:hypothetical protein
MATSGLSNSTENKLEIILDVPNLNTTNTIISRSDGVNVVVERAYTLAGNDKDAYKFLITLFKSKSSIATYYLLKRV